MSKTADIFIALLRGAMTEKTEEIDLSDADIESLYSLAKFHDLAHICCYELERRGKLPEGETGEKFREQYNMAIFRHAKRETTIAQTRKILEDARIPFILLKGAVIMDLYPEPWMRTSADVDILVAVDDFKKACERFEKEGFRKTSETSHDVSFNAVNGVHTELHFTLIEDYKLPDTVPALEKIWDHVYGKDNGVELFLDDEMFYYYHIVHMAKHCKLGGCGVRPFLDLWLLDHRIEFDNDKRRKLLQSGNVFTFAKAAESLSETWFSGTDGDPDLFSFEEYVINGGVYGTKEQGIALRKKKTDNRFKYYMKRIFPPYAYMKYSFPALKKMPVLLPFCHVARWFKLLDPKTRKKAKNEINIERSVDNETGERVEALMKKLEIW